MKGGIIRWLGCAGLAFALAILSGCVTGQRALENGQYTKAVHLSSQRLSKHANSPKAREVLIQAFPAAKAKWLERARAARADEANRFRWEEVVNAYAEIHEMVEQIRHTPVARSKKLDLRYHHAELEEALAKAAAARRLAGDEMLALQERYAARDAYHHYTRSLGFVPDQPEVRLNQAMAKDLGTIRVAFDPVTAHRYGINPFELEQEILREIDRFPFHEFIEVVPYHLAGPDGPRPPHHHIQINVRHADIGREFERCYTTSHEREIVVGKTKDDPPKDITKKVTATVFEYRREIESDASAICDIYDNESDDIIFSRHVSAWVDWDDSWYRVKGDHRALPPGIRESYEPSRPSYYQQAQDLTRELADEVYDELRAFYRER